MGVRNDWADTYVDAGKRGNAALVAGGRVLGCAGTFELAAADDDTSVIKLARLPSNAILLSFEINNDAIAGCTSVDAGFYETGSFTAVDANILMAAADINGGKALGSEQNGLSALPIADIGDKVWELLGKTIDNKAEAYDLALTFNTIGSAAGTVSYRLTYILG